MSYITTAERVGRTAGQRELVLRQLARKCAELSVEVEARITALSDEQLADLGDALLDFANADDLERWLNHITSPERNAARSIRTAECDSC